MPKLRHGTNDTDKFAQWLGRKCRNHHPLEELGLGGSEKRPNIYKAGGKGDVKVREDNPSTVVYAAANRVFELVVREVDPEEYHNVPLKAVGH